MTDQQDEDYSPTVMANISLICAVRLIQRGRSSAEEVALPFGDASLLETFRAVVSEIMQTLTTPTPYGMITAEDLAILAEVAKARLTVEGYQIDEEMLH